MSFSVRPAVGVSCVAPVRLACPAVAGRVRLAFPAGSVLGSPGALFLGSPACRARCWRFSVACPVRGARWLWFWWCGPGRVPSRAWAAAALSRRARCRVLA